jgi:hypothetical protein
MLFDQELYIGVDSASGRNGFVWTALDRRLEPVAIREGSLEDLVTFIRGIPNGYVAVNSARGPGLRLMDDPVYRAEIRPEPREGKYTQFRVCEYLLAARNIRVSSVPADPDRLPRSMRYAFELYVRLAPHSAIQVIEYHAHAAFCGLLGRIPFQKNSLEGRIQRQLILADQEVHLKDAMDYFEEITRRRLLAGVLPENILHPTRVLDALVGSLTAWKRHQNPADTLPIGDAREGLILLPVAQLKDKYI